jgi:hypothetical protein
MEANRMSEEKIPKRWTVTVERELIVYADSSTEAENRALTYMRQTTTEHPATRPIKVVKVTELEPDVAHGPEVDQAPSRETRT